MCSIHLLLDLCLLATLVGMFLPSCAVYCYRLAWLGPPDGTLEITRCDQSCAHICRCIWMCLPSNRSQHTHREGGQDTLIPVTCCVLVQRVVELGISCVSLSSLPHSSKCLDSYCLIISN